MKEIYKIQPIIRCRGKDSLSKQVFLNFWNISSYFFFRDGIILICFKFDKISLFFLNFGKISATIF